MTLEAWQATLLGTVSTALGIWFGAYLKKNAENFATHEDFQSLLSEVKQTTEATKSIEARISAETWNHQQLWEMKRDLFVEALATIGELEDALVSYAVLNDTPEVTENDKAVTKMRYGARQKFNKAARKLSNISSRTQLLCSTETALVVAKSAKALHDARASLTAKPRNRFSEGEGPEMVNYRAKILEAAQKELGIATRAGRVTANQPVSAQHDD